MRCTRVELPGGVAWLCGGRAPAKRCQVPHCGRVAVAECDFPVRRKGVVGTCDWRMCAEHRKTVGEDRDYCPAHAKAPEQLPLERPREPSDDELDAELAQHAESGQR